jgi:ABC-type multidrug transport system fused ATPase/permease subunit
MSFFHLSNLELALVLFGVVLGCTLLGSFLGRKLSRHADSLREPLGVLQAALLGLVALILAFGMTMAVGRYDARRTAVVDDANAIGTTYLRAQTLREPVRTRSLDLLTRYTDDVIVYSNAVPGSRAYRDAIARSEGRQRELWRLGADALAGSPRDSAPRLYIETLNEMIDMQTVRLSALSNRVPSVVLVITLLGAAVGLGLLALYLAMVSRGVVTVVLAAVFVSLLLYMTFDLDRPARGFVQVPDTPLVALRASMALPPAAPAPHRP